MKNENIDFSVLDNADTETAKKMSKICNAVDKNEKEHIYNMCKQMYNHKNEKDDVTVSGVEPYKHFRWQRVAGIAACVVLVGSIIVVGTVLLNRKRIIEPAESDTTDYEQVTETTQTTPEPVTETVTEPKTEQFLELPIHNDESIYVETLEEAKNMQLEHSFEMSWDDRYGVNTEHYAGLLLSDGYDINSLEAKSYIYHMMLKSYLYFDSVKGTLNSDGISNTVIEFRTDLNKWESYAKVSDHDTDTVIGEEYMCNDKLYNVTSASSTYRETFSNKSDKIMLIEDNYIHIDIAPPDYGLTGFGSGSPICGIENNYLCPYQYAASRMREFDNWQITGFTETNGRTAAVISGTLSGVCDYEMKVDIYTGIMLELTENAYNGNSEHTYFSSIEIDVPIEPVVFDSTGYEQEDYR